MTTSSPDESQHMSEVASLGVASQLKQFVEAEVLPGTGVALDEFWSGLAGMVGQFAQRNQELLDVRLEMQSAIDEWYLERDTSRIGPGEQEAFLQSLGYLVPEGPEFSISTSNIDPEMSTIAGPQLVVPVTNSRYATNAANARWGSLYDAFYGTDAMGESPPDGAYDPERGARVIDRARRFLDDVFPLAGSSHAQARHYSIGQGGLTVGSDAGEVLLQDPDQLIAFKGERARPTAILLRNNGLHVELQIDPKSPIGRRDLAGVSDIVLESAVTVIMDCEDAVATVDAEDKVTAYRNWLGLMQGTLSAEVHKGDRSFIRSLAADRTYSSLDGGNVVLPGRSLMLVRNVGQHLYANYVVGPDGNPVPEGFIDAMVTVACALHDLRGVASHRNSRAGSVYVVKPKMHGPAEVALADEMFGHVEEVFGLPTNTIKIGVMDEERRTSANLKECIRAVQDRLVFINTGFLDRTGDEIHTSMQAGPMVRKTEMKSQPWMEAYENRNVDIGIACGLPGRAQIGKGMWAAPDRMAAMLEEKIEHPLAGATCAWVPSPTAATLHATHYHYVDVQERQEELLEREMAPLRDLLTAPVVENGDWTESERIEELENNAQGILGYVVRWVDQGVGSSKVPDIRGLALMEDRATCRISSQHMANWLLHGVTTQAEISDVMRRMAAVVDEQNAGDEAYIPMAPDYNGSAFRAALGLVLEGVEQPSGYTEPILHKHRIDRKRTRSNKEK